MKIDIGRSGVMRGRRFRSGARFWGALLSTAALIGLLAPQVSAGVRPTIVTAGELHSCVLTSSGTVLCWGANASGQLGDGTTVARLTPVAVSGLTSGVQGVVAGGGTSSDATPVTLAHTCAITSGGGLVCWGANANGQLGNNSTTDSPIPVQVSGLTSGVIAVVAGYGHTCAITSGGDLKCWGRNSEGQLGIGNFTTPQLTPITVTGMSSGVVAVTAGYSHTCAILSGGALKCWGSGGNGQLGNGTQNTYHLPVAVSGLGSGVSAVAAGWRSTCAIVTGGAAKCWGINSNGQLGIGTKTSFEPSPVAVTGLSSGVGALAGGRYHACALTSGGAVLCWGVNTSGQLGDGTTVEHLTPSPSNLTIGAVKLVTGSRHTCAVTAGGAARCWGWNSNGQLGNGDTTNRLERTAVNGLAGWPPRDVDGDAKSDVVWRHTTRGEVWLWPMNGAARTAEMYVRTVPDTGWEIRGVGDFNGDGMADILWRHKTTGMIYLWPMNGSTVLSETYVGIVDPAYDIVSVGDYDADGKFDILWRHLTNGELWVWLMDGATTLDAIYVSTVDPGYEVVGSGDLNGDGWCDLVWRHNTNGEVWVWLTNDTGMPTQTLVAVVPDTGYKVKGVVDFTGDGRADIVWHHNTRGEVWIWTMDGDTRLSQTYVSTVPDTGYRIVGNGDYDLDGKADILWHHATRGEVWVWLMDGTTKLSGTWVASVPEVGYQIVK
jgi:alpha-tubulin suppressor-like RCC1 family protein